MSQPTSAHRIFHHIKTLVPKVFAQKIRGAGIAVWTPFHSFYQNGHARSAFAGKAVDKQGRPLPWYTYPAIDFLKSRDYGGRCILEFGAGQSTLWWAGRAKNVTALEENKEWYEALVGNIPENSFIHWTPLKEREEYVKQVKIILDGAAVKYDVIIVDGGFREQAAELAPNYLKAEGVLIIDNAEGYGMCERFADKGMQRVDFIGNAPGVPLPHVTSLFFGEKCFLFNPQWPMLHL